MAQQTINVGTTANDGTGDSLRNGFIKVNQNFTELYTNRISGSGTDNYIPRFNGTNALENSIIFDNGTNVGIGTTSPTTRFQIGELFKVTSDAVTTWGSTNSMGTLSWDANLAIIGGLANTAVQFRANNAEVMRLTTTGNIGIGTTSPSQKVQIGDGTGTGSQYLRISSSASEIYIGQSGGTILGLAGNSAQLILGDHLNFPLAIGTTNVQPLIFGTTNNERMRITSGGNVGIGTTSPSAKFDINDSTSIQQNFSIANDRHISIYADASQSIINSVKNVPLVFRTFDAERMRITSGGNVGIGTTSPGSKFHVLSSGEVSRLQSSTTTLYNTYVANGVDVGYIGNGTGVVGGGSATDFGIQATNNFVLATGGGTERMRIDSSGNVLVGQTSPIYSATNRANFTIGKSAGSILVLGTSTASNGYFFYNNTDLEIANSTASGSVFFRTTGTERMRITSTGIVQVSSGDIFGGNLASDYGALTLRGGYGATTGSASKIEIRGYEGGGAMQGALIFYTNGTERMKISQGGLITSLQTYNNPSGASANLGVSSSGEFYRSTSSKKYKKNIENYSKGLNEIMQMRPVSYNSINEQEEGILYAGLIAEEVHELGMNEFVQYAEDGTPDALSYSNMVSLLIKGIQEQQQQINELKTLIN